MKNSKNTLVITAILILALAGNLFSQQASVVDNPPGPFNLDYSPVDGETVRVNPPPFIWVPTEEAVSYRLEISKDFAFKSVHVLQEKIGITTFAITDTLAPGVWYWRYGVTLKNGQIIKSKSRQFTIPEKVRLFPYPELDKVIESIQHERPRLFVPQKELAAFKQKAATFRQEDIDLLRRTCDEFIGEDLIIEPPYVAGEGAEYGKNFVKILRETRPPMDKMETSALTYLLTGDTKYGHEAKRRLLHFSSWNPEGSTSYVNNDEPAMWVMMRGVRAYDWTFDLFSSDERERVESSMRVRARQFYDHLLNQRQFHTNPYESHAGRTIGFLGEVSLAFIHEWPEAREYLNYVLTNFWNVYPAWGKEDGGWHEGPSYWSYYMSFALHFAVPLRQLTGIDLMQKPFFQNTPYYKLYTNPPYAQISPFGDNEQAGPSLQMGTLMYWFGSLFDDPYFAWYADARGSSPGNEILGFLLGRDDLIAKRPDDLPSSRYFPGVGLISMHTALGDAENDVHLLFHSDPYGAISHAHADQNAFTLEAFGEALAIASGYYPWYGSDHHSNWQWHTRSSNMITFDGGEGQVIRSPDSHGRIVAYETGDHFDYLLGDAVEAYGGKLDLCQRHILHLKEGVFLIYDEISSPEPRRFEWRLHAFEKMELDTEERSIIISKGKARLKVLLLTPEELVFEQTDQTGWPPENGAAPQWHFTASTKEKVSTCRFMALLMPYREGDENMLPSVKSEITDKFAGILLEKAGHETVAFIRTQASKGKVTFHGLTSDGKVAAVQVGGKAESAPFQHGGSVVRYKR